MSRLTMLMESMECRRLLSLDALGPEVTLAGDAQAVPSAGNQEQAVIAAGEDQNGNPVSLAVWTDYRTAIHEPANLKQIYFDTELGRLTDIYAARIDGNGNVIDTTPIVVDQSEFYQGHPQVGWNGTHWLVSYMSERAGDRTRNDVRAVRIAADGTIVDTTPITIQQAPSTLDRFFPLSVGSNGDEFVLAYTSYAGSNTKEIRAVRIANDGTILNPGGQLLHSATTTWTPHADVEYLPTGNPGGQYLFAYQNGIVGYVQRLDAELNPLGAAMSISGGEAQNPQIASNGVDQWYVTAHEAINSYIPIYGRTVSPTGAFGAPVLIDDGGAASLGFDGTNYVVSFTDWVFGPGWQTHIRKVSPNGTLQPRESINGVAGEESSPQLVRVGSGVQAVYQQYGIEGQSLVSGRYIAGTMLFADGTKSAQAAVSLAAPRQSQIDLADNGNGFLAVWRDDSDLGFKVMAQRLDATGAAIDAEPVELGDVNPTRQLGPVRGHELPSVAFNGDVYLVTWALGNQIYARRVGLDGQPIDAAPFAVMPGNYPDVDALGETFLIAGSYEVVNHRRALYGARVSGAGTLLDPTPVQISIGQWNEDPSVAAVGNRWLVAWESNATHDNEASSIRAAFVNPDMTFSTLVAANAGDVPVIAYDGTGRALVAWRAGSEQTASDIMGRVFDTASGAAITGEFVISAAQETQSMPNVAFDGANFIVTWIDQRNYGFPQQDRDDVYAARVSADGVVLDPDGVAVANSDLPETAPTVGVSGAGPVFAYSRLVNAAPYGTMRLVTRATSDTIAPQVSGGSFAFQTGQWVELRFSEDVGASLSADDLSVLNLTTNQPLLPESMTYDPATWTARFNFDAPIADGNYRATLPAGSVNDPFGNALAADYTLEFAFLSADANRDGRVNLDDFNVLAANFGRTDTDFGRGDFNYDGRTNLDDFNILASRFGASLPAGATSVIGGADDRQDEMDDVSDLLA